ncbi:hypothetical protein AVEN_147246-1 [Araneus ventricosus]|uniref:Uncharacterized protein n=1 Tax=Araneus ventricosus TaxID=182803 RepID=A0A4Y2R266_ARAVE|nr:hypothetical protein AVEN_147246-1 [Araneus ventricosus]
MTLLFRGMEECLPMSGMMRWTFLQNLSLSYPACGQRLAKTSQSSEERQGGGAYIGASEKLVAFYGSSEKTGNSSEKNSSLGVPVEKKILRRSGGERNCESLTVIGYYLRRG